MSAIEVFKMLSRSNPSTTAGRRDSVRSQPPQFVADRCDDALFGLPCRRGARADAAAGCRVEGVVPDPSSAARVSSSTGASVTTRRRGEPGPSAVAAVVATATGGRRFSAKIRSTRPMPLVAVVSVSIGSRPIRFGAAVVPSRGRTVPRHEAPQLLADTSEVEPWIEILNQGEDIALRVHLGRLAAA
jgi:hypothetical protein